SVKIFATIPLPNKIHEREMDKTDIPGTFNAGATLGPVNETNMTRIWNKHKQTNTPLKRKVFVGLSGGVDSAVAAYLLKRQGYDVTGVYLKCWEGLETPSGVQFEDTCSWKEERRDALQVAAVLKIPFKTYDFVEEYRRDVVDDFFREYALGRTPNPDVLCNRDIKFKSFLNRAVKEGADAIATGHYVLKEKSKAKSQNLNSKVKNVYDLKIAKDKSKDQSYFLWTLGQRELEHSLFPVGAYHKVDIRRIAKAAGLPTASKPDSQGICFIGKVSVENFLRAKIPAVSGRVLTASGKQVGTHEGAAFYTIGQRHGLALTAKLPYYVAAINIQDNTITVAEGNSDEILYKHEVFLTNTSWINGEPVKGGNYVARLRYRQPLEKVDYTGFSNGRFQLIFKESQRAVAPGQSLVLYDGERVVGGGIIAEDSE
ncbi:MAG: tRNA 2-thiouridine(34) synthase MnmA, partial [Patescibacteria group bacterium]